MSSSSTHSLVSSSSFSNIDVVRTGSPYPRTPSPSLYSIPRTDSPSPYGTDASDTDQHNLKTIQAAYQTIVLQRRNPAPSYSSSSSSSSSGQGIAFETKKDGTLHITTGKNSKATIKKLQEVVNKVCYPLSNSSNPLEVTQALQYLTKLNRWLLVVLGPNDFKKITHPPIHRALGGPKESRHLTGKGFPHWGSALKKFYTLSVEREKFETANPLFYDLPEQGQVAVIKRELGHATNQIAQLTEEIDALKLGLVAIETEITGLEAHITQQVLSDIETGTISEDETSERAAFLAELQEQRTMLRNEIQSKMSDKSYLEIYKTPVLNKMLNYYYFLHMRLTTQIQQFGAEAQVVKDLAVEMDAFNSLLWRKTLPIGAGVNNPVAHYASNIFGKEDLSIGVKQLLGVGIESCLESNAPPASVEKPAIDFNFQIVGEQIADGKGEGYWAGHHEVLAYALDQKLLGGALQIAPAIWSTNPLINIDSRNSTEHGYIKHKLTAEKIESTPDLELKLDPENVLWMLIGLALFKNPDLHSGNFLVKKHTETPDRHQLIPVDFGRMLLANPVSKDAACRTSVFVDWLNALDERYGPAALQFTEAQKDTIRKITPSMVTASIHEVVGYEHLSQTERNTWNSKILHMQVNVVLLQLAVENNLNAKQLLALLMPNIGTQFTVEQKEQLIAMTTEFEERLQDRAFWAEHGKGYEATKQEEFKGLVAVGKNPYFDTAWSRTCKAGIDGELKKGLQPFLKRFKQELFKTLATVPADAEAIYGDKEKIHSLKTFGL
ncbi:MAG: hypothetical protein V4492_03180 [Chlamydiota bacterium]